jgi:hypothetical protein
MRLAMFATKNTDFRDLIKRTTAVVLCSMVLLSMGCGGEEEKKGTITLPSTEDPDPVFLDFKVQTNLPVHVPHYLHRSSGDSDTWSTACRIPQNAAPRTQINCLLEINELDLWYQSFEFRVEIPPNMCEYVVPYGFWFFQYEPRITSTANVTITDTDGVITTNLAPDNDEIELFYDDSGAPQLKCLFDYSDSNGPNCCSGKTRVTEITFDTPEGGTIPEETNRSTRTIDWGGKIGNCAVGPGAFSENAPSRTEKQNLPTYPVFDTKLGRTLVMKMPAPMTGGDSDNAYNTNGYSANWRINSGTSPVPAPMNFPPLGLGNPDYVWSCVDGAFEEKARITLQVREWNTYAEFIKRGVGSPNPDASTAPGESEANDFWDWDDFIDNLLNAYPGPLL